MGGRRLDICISWARRRRRRRGGLALLRYDEIQAILSADAARSSRIKRKKTRSKRPSRRAQKISQLSRAVPKRQFPAAKHRCPHHSTKLSSANHSLNHQQCLSPRPYERKRSAHSSPGRVRRARDHWHGYRGPAMRPSRQHEDGSTRRQRPGRAMYRAWTRCMRDTSRRTGRSCMSGLSMYTNTGTDGVKELRL